jgi:hypothetical protein
MEPIPITLDEKYPHLSTIYKVASEKEIKLYFPDGKEFVPTEEDNVHVSVYCNFLKGDQGRFPCGTVSFDKGYTLDTFCRKAVANVYSWPDDRAIPVSMNIYRCRDFYHFPPIPLTIIIPCKKE